MPSFLARNFVLPLCALAGAALGLEGHALAAPADPLNRPPAVTTVYQLPRPDYDPPGIVLGSFLLSPLFDENLSGNDNIYASDRALASDLIYTNSEALTIASQWPLNSVTARLFHAHDLYADHGTENANSWTLEGGARLAVSEGGFLQLDAGITQQPQKRNSPEADRQALRRPLYNSIPASVSYSQDWGRWNNRLEVGMLQTAYISAAQASRNGIQMRYRDRLSYAVGGNTWLFLQGAYSTHHWNVRSSLRDFDTITGMAGVTFQIADLVDLDFGAGVVRQSYDYSSFSDLVTPSLNGHLTWNITPLTTILVSADRSVTGLETFCDGGLSNPACLAIPPGLATTIDQIYLATAPQVVKSFCDFKNNQHPVCPPNPLPATFLTFSQLYPTLAKAGVASVCQAFQSFPICSGPLFNTSLRGTLEVTSAEIAVQHEFWHNILGQLRFRYERDKFDPVDLVNDNYNVEVSARFPLNRFLELNASYNLNIRTANQDLLLYNSGPYQGNLVSLQLKAAL